MKKPNLLALIPFMLMVLQLSAQTSEAVHFDNYTDSTHNDFATWFSGGLDMSQIPTDGITGGCLNTPDGNNWGNDNAYYCSKYRGNLGSSYATTICFKYDTTNFNSSGYDRATSIWMIPGSDFNHYLFASVAHNQTIEILSYSFSNNPGPYLAMVQDHWYRLSLHVLFTGGAGNDQLDLGVNVDDLGLTGTDPPIPLGNDNGSFNDGVFFSDTAIAIAITGSKWGGAKYLDDFTYQGLKSADSCIVPVDTIPDTTTTTAYIKELNPVHYRVQNDLLIVNSASSESGEMEIMNLNGQKIATLPLEGETTSYNIGGLPSGIYLLSIKSRGKISVAKFNILR